MYYSPYKISECTIKIEMLNDFFVAAKTTHLILCQFLLTKLSLVSITSLYSSHKKTLIFNGILIFQRSLCKKLK
jgi:hypothetical protein